MYPKTTFCGICGQQPPPEDRLQVVWRSCLRMMKLEYVCLGDCFTILRAQSLLQKPDLGSG